MIDEQIVVAAPPAAGDMSSLVQRVMVAFEVMSGFMPRDGKAQAVMQNGRDALRALAEALCPAAQEGEGFHHENLTGQQRRAACGSGRGGVGDHQG